MINEEEFFKIWNETSLEDRYTYTINSPLIVVIIFVLIITWIIFFIVLLSKKIDYVSSLLFGSGWFIITILIIFHIQKVRIRGKSSGVIIAPWGFLWKDGQLVEEVRWEEISLDDMQFQSGQGRLGHLEGFIDIRIGEKTKRLIVFTPFMRLEGIEGFFSRILTALKNNKRK